MVLVFTASAPRPIQSLSRDFRGSVVMWLCDIGQDPELRGLETSG